MNGARAEKINLSRGSSFSTTCALDTTFRAVRKCRRFHLQCKRWKQTDHIWGISLSDKHFRLLVQQKLRLCHLNPSRGYPPKALNISFRVQHNLHLNIWWKITKTSGNILKHNWNRWKGSLLTFEAIQHARICRSATGARKKIPRSLDKQSHVSRKWLISIREL